MRNYRINHSILSSRFLIVYERDLIEVIEDIKISTEKFYHKTTNVYEKNFFFKLAHNFDNFIYFTKIDNFKNYLQKTIKFLRSINNKSSKNVIETSKLIRSVTQTCNKLEIYINSISLVMISKNIKKFKIAAKRVNYGVNKIVAYRAAESITEFINMSNCKIDTPKKQRYYIF